MSTFSLRVAEPADGPHLARIYAPYVLETTVSLEVMPPSTDEMRRRLDATLPRWPWLVATDPDDGVVAYAYGGAFRARVGYRWTVEVSAYVAAGAHRQGLGRRLMEALLALLAEQGYRQAMAGIGLPNAASTGLHEAMGFTHVGTSPAVGRKFNRWQDVGWWQLPLGSGRDIDPTEPRPLDHLDREVVMAILG